MAEKTDETSENQKIFEGMLFAMNEDIGPTITVNLSPLNDREAIATAIQGITAVGMGEGDVQGLFGPLPVPYNNNYRALVFTFRVATTTSDDPEINEQGRFCALFLIFQKEKLNYIANVFAMIESTLLVYRENYLLREEDLFESSLKVIFEDIVSKLKVKPKIRLFTIENNITVEYEEFRIVMSKESTIIILEQAKTINVYYPKSMDPDKIDYSKKVLNLLNSNEYQNSCKVVKISSKKKFINLLAKHNIEVVE
ncbi:MAG: hypothetical protein ACTSQN_12980 [Candidatus Heimdallarchaeota archaeon]